MAKQDFGNGLMYDPDTGEVVINDPTGKQVYQFDPRENQTNYNGTTYSGRYNPLILGEMTGQQITSGYDSLIKDKATFTNGDPTNSPNAVKYWNNLGQTAADQIAFNGAYWSASKGASQEDQSFFDTLKAMSADRLNTPATPDQRTGFKQTDPITPQPAFRPTDPINPDVAQKPQLPTQSPTSVPAALPPLAPKDSQQPTQPDSQQTQQPDYDSFFKAMYSQLSPYLSTQSTTPTTGSSSSFNVGSAPKAPTIATNNASPDFSLGGYNPQPGYSSPSSGPSGKGAAQSGQQSQGMATGQFGSK